MNRRILLLVVIILFSEIINAQYLSKQWDHTYGGHENETMMAIKQLNDHGFILGGYTRSDTGGTVSQHTQGGTDFWIINTDSNGVLRWDRRFGGTLEDRLYSLDVGSRG